MNNCNIFWCMAIIIATMIVHGEALIPGCKNNTECTDLCGFQGQGECVNGKYCKCSDCPMRSVYELTTLPKVCTLDPTCICPAPVLSLTKGRIYTGHRCLHMPSFSPVCICFCLPTTPGAIIDVLKCPVPKEGASSTTSIPQVSE